MMKKLSEMADYQKKGFKGVVAVCPRYGPSIFFPQPKHDNNKRITKVIKIALFNIFPLL